MGSRKNQRVIGLSVVLTLLVSAGLVFLFHPFGHNYPSSQDSSDHPHPEQVMLGQRLENIILSRHLGGCDISGDHADTHTAVALCTMPVDTRVEQMILTIFPTQEAATRFFSSTRTRTPTPVACPGYTSLAPGEYSNGSDFARFGAFVCGTSVAGAPVLVWIDYVNNLVGQAFGTVTADPNALTPLFDWFQTHGRVI